MAHKTLIGGTAYEIKGGRDLIGGTGYAKKKGRVLVNGTGYDISFSKGIPLNTITPGAILMLNESGSPVQFYIAKHDYESGLNGAGRTLLVRKDCYNLQAFSDNYNYYLNSSVDSWLRYIYLGLLDADIQNAIGTTKFYYTNSSGNVATLERAIFLLSATELGGSGSWFNVEGSALDIASSLRIAYLPSASSYAVSWWLRTPNLNNASLAVYCQANGDIGSDFYNRKAGSRPAFTLPGTLALAQNPDGTYSIAA